MTSQERVIAALDFCGPGPFERLQTLRTATNLFYDLAEQTPQLFDLIRMVHEFNVRHVVRRYVNAFEAVAQTHFRAT